VAIKQSTFLHRLHHRPDKAGRTSTHALESRGHRFLNLILIKWRRETTRLR
jgi:hypothetical protein